MKTVDTLVRDIYHLMETKEIPEGVNLEAQCKAFGEVMAKTLYDQLQPEKDRTGLLRLSAIGKPDKKIWSAFKGVAGEPLRGPTYIKFLYGHLIEAMLLSLAKVAGHQVTDEQKEVSVEGVKGHMDCRIDGMLTDVKSCSSYGFKKFKNHTLHEDDPFGYIAQIKAYAHAEGDHEYGWLAMDKQNGTLAWLQYDESDVETHYYPAVAWDAGERVRHVKKMVASDISPDICYEPVPDGKSGNEKLSSGCSYCDYKHNCFPNLKTYVYASGPRYLTKVVREPRALEIPEEF